MSISVEELMQEIELTGYKINKYCDLLLLGSTAYADRFILVLSDAFSSLFPKIMDAYNNLECLKNEDSTIWSIQLKRVFDALNSDDDMLKIDVLKFETVGILLIFLEELRRYNEQ